MKQVYLAGPIAGFSYREAGEWRATIAEMVRKFSINCFSPLRGEEYSDFNAELDNLGSQTYNGVSITPKNFVRRDWFDVKNSDAVVVMLPMTCTKVSIGTMIEVGWASALDIPIIGIVPDGDWGVHYHPFLEELFDFQVKNSGDAAEILKVLLLP